MFFYALDIWVFDCYVSGHHDANGYQSIPDRSAFIPTAILYQMAIIILFTTNMHHWFFAGIVKSYQVLPIGQAHYGGNFINDLIQMTSIFRLVS